MRRALLLVFVAVLSGCASPLPSIPPPTTLRGPVVPTRAPTIQPTLAVTSAATLVPLPPASDTPSATVKLAAMQTAEPAPTIHVAGALLAGRPASGTIDDANPALLYTFLGQAGDVVNLSLKARSGDLDSFLLVLDPEGREVARDDDAGDGTHDAAIRGLRLPASGAYMVVAARFLQVLGATRGDFALRYDPADADAPSFGVFSRTITYNSLQDGTISDASPSQVFTFSGSAGDVVTIQASASSGDLQPVVTLTNGQGALVEQSRAADVQGQPSASIKRIQLPTTGTYSIEVARPQAQTQSGDFRLKLALDQPVTPDTPRPLYAVLHPLRSFSVVGAAASVPGYVAGVRVDSGQQVGYQAVLTYALPALDLAEVKTSQLEFGACVEQGGGFSVVGPLDLFDDPTGASSDNPDSFRPSVGASRVALIASCNPVDVTEAVRKAYQSGAKTIQFWIVAPKTPVDGQPHVVEFTAPRLAIVGNAAG